MELYDNYFFDNKKICKIFYDILYYCDVEISRKL